MICECNEKPPFKDKIAEAEIRRLLDIYFRASFTTDDSTIDESKYIYKADPYYKTTEFKEKYRCALFKIIAKRHKIYYHENNSIIKVSPSIVARTQNYLESCCDIVGWFKDTYTEDNTKYSTMGDIYENFKTSQIYLEMSRNKKENYSKIKFFELLRTNIFFKKYYKDTIGSIYNVINGWVKTDILIDM
jgi:phage/plasmid-associated DNA primase